MKQPVKLSVGLVQLGEI